MLKYKLLHPEILEALAAAGHNSRVLIADGNYPFSTTLGPKAQLVFLNLSPGCVTVAQVLEALASAIPIQGASVMAPAKTGPYAMAGDPPAWNDYRKILRKNGANVKLEKLDIAGFYAAAAGEDVALTIATGDQSWYANVMLSIGAVAKK
ncbi:MAG: RbsD/FucU family protein [bacterium]